MQTLLEIPLFRTASPAVATQAPKAATTATTPTIGDLTDYIGQDVDGATWAALQAECQRRYGELWTIYATQTGDVWHVTRLHANPEEGEEEPLSLDWMNDNLPIERNIRNV